jgi:hypothetical protein
MSEKEEKTDKPPQMSVACRDSGLESKLTMKSVVDILGISEQKLREWCKELGIPSRKAPVMDNGIVSSNRFFFGHEVKKLMERVPERRRKQLGAIFSDEGRFAPGKVMGVTKVREMLFQAAGIHNIYRRAA